LPVLGTAERAQIDQGLCHYLHAIVPVRLSVHCYVPPLALRLTPAPEVEDNGYLPARQGEGRSCVQKSRACSAARGSNREEPVVTMGS